MKIEDYRKAFNQLGSALAHDSANADALFTFAAEIQVCFYTNFVSAVYLAQYNIIYPPKFQFMCFVFPETWRVRCRRF